MNRTRPAVPTQDLRNMPCRWAEVCEALPGRFQCTLVRSDGTLARKGVASEVNDPSSLSSAPRSARNRDGPRGGGPLAALNRTVNSRGPGGGTSEFGPPDVRLDVSWAGSQVRATGLCVRWPSLALCHGALRRPVRSCWRSRPLGESPRRPGGRPGALVIDHRASTLSCPRLALRLGWCRA